MPTIVNIPSVGTVQFPDGMSDADIENAIQKNILPQTKADNSTAQVATPTINQQQPLSKTAQEIKDSDMAGIVGFNTAMGRLAHGIMQPILESGLLGNNIAAKSKAYAQNREQLFQAAQQADPTGAKLGELVGQAAPGFLVPGGVAGGLLARTLTGAVAGGGLGAGQYVNDGQSRLANTAMGVLGGAVSVPVLGGLLSKNPYVKAGTGAALTGLYGLTNSDSIYKTPVYAAAGAAIPFVPGLAKQGVANLINKATGKPTVNAIEQAIAPAVTKNILQNVNPEQALATQQAGQRIGINLTPAEASGNPLAAAEQGKLGTSQAGAQNLYNFAQQEAQNQKNAVNNLLNAINPKANNAASDIRNVAQNYQNGYENVLLNNEQGKINSFLNMVSPTANDASNDIRTTAQNIIQGQKQELQQKAQPLYDTAYLQKIPQKEINALASKDGTIDNAIKGVLSDPKYQFELQGYAPNSVKVLDLAKRRIDAQIEQAKNFGDNDAVRVLNNSKNRLVSATDSFSPIYAQARSIFSEGSKPIEQIENSNIGKLANLSDVQLKNVSKIIFDPNQTNINVLRDLRDKISQQDPALWNSLVRNEMERRLSNSSEPLSGQLMFNKVLGNQRDFQQFSEATKNIPDANAQLAVLRNQFANSADKLKQLRGTDIARLANLNDAQLKNVSKTIFDPNQTNLNALASLRDKIKAVNPDAWRQIVRNEMERRLDLSNGDYSGSTFFGKILRNERDFKQFITATQGMPDVQSKLLDMRVAFKNLINPVTAKTAARNASLNFDTPARGEIVNSLLTHVKNMVSGQYDQAAVKMITSGQWDKEFATLQNIKDKNVRAARIAALLGKISASSGIQNINNSSATQNNQ